MTIKSKLDKLVKRLIDFLDLATRFAELSLVLIMIWFFTKLIKMFFGELPGAL